MKAASRLLHSASDVVASPIASSVGSHSGRSSTSMLVNPAAANQAAQSTRTVSEAFALWKR